MKFLLFSLIVLFSFKASSQSCLGTWITIDDKTGKRKSKVKLYKSKGKMYGKITYVYPNKKNTSKCLKCKGDRKNKPIIGLQIVRGLWWNGSEWEGGTIVDPENGKVYKVKIWIDRGNYDRLKVRGYSYGFYRTQTWKKVKD